MASQDPPRVVRALNPEVWTAEQFLIKTWTPECHLELSAFICGGLFSCHGCCGLPSTGVFKTALQNPVALLQIWYLSCLAPPRPPVTCPAVRLLPRPCCAPRGEESPREQAPTFSELQHSVYFQEWWLSFPDCCAKDDFPKWTMKVSHKTMWSKKGIIKSKTLEFYDLCLWIYAKEIIINM